LLLLGSVVAAVMASPQFDPSWTRLSAGTEIPELRTPTSRTYSNDDGTFTVDITPMRTGEADSQDPCQPTSTGCISYFVYHGYEYYSRYTPKLAYGGYTVAYAKFDLTPIPYGSMVRAAQFRRYQYEVTGTPVRTRCIYANLDPGSSSDTAVYSAVTNGTVLAESLFSGVGWGGHELNQQGVARLQGRLAQDWIALGIKSVSGSAASYGTTDDSLQSCLRVTYVGPTESDIQAVRAEPPYPLTRTTDTALLVLTNLGPRSSEPFRVYVVSPGLWPNSALAGPTPVYWTTCVKVPLPVPDSTDRLVDYSLWATCANDPWQPNDTTRLTRCWVFAPNTYAAEGLDASQFPPPGWVVVDNDGGSRCWQRRSDDDMVHSGTGFATCIHEPTGNSDDWLISGPIYPRKGQPDSVGFYCRVDQGTYPYLQTWVMRGQRVADTTRNLTSDWVSEYVYHRQSASLDDFDGDTIYIGFRYQSSGSGGGLCLDDVWFSGVVRPDTNAADIKVVSAEPPYPLVTGKSNKALFALTNRGPKSSGDVWTYATAPGLATESAPAGVLTIGETAAVKLPLPVPRSADAMVDFTLWTAFTNDPWPDGVAKLTCWAFPANTYYAEGFDIGPLPSYHWAIVDNDNGNQRWQRRTDDSVVHSGAGFAMCAREQTGPNDDWLIGGPVYPTTDEPDSLGFFHRLYRTGSPLALQTWAMRAPRIVDTIRCLTSKSVTENTYRRQSAALDQFDGDTIYIGFRCQSSGSWNGLCLDDVWFSGFVPPDTSDTTDTTVTPKPREAVQRTTAKLPDFAFAPNPSDRRAVTVRSALAVRKRRRVTMRDVAGRAVRTFALDPPGIAHIDLRDLPPGVYVATLDGTMPLLSRKLIITLR
jgi:hypothetical protein